MSDYSDDKDKLPLWEDIPQPQIVEITPNPAPSEIPPAMEKDLIESILNGDPGIFEMPIPQSTNPDLPN